MSELNGYKVSEFLKHLTPTLLLSKFEGAEPMTYLPYVWERNRKIAEGEMKTYTKFDEHEYNGPITPQALGAWLLTFDASWGVSLGSEDEPLYVYRSKQVPYTEEEIQAAKDFIANNPKPEQKSVQFRAPHLDFGKQDDDVLGV